MYCCHQQKIQKMSHFWHKDHNTGNKYDNLTNNAIYFIYSLSSIRWYISFLHFKTFKIQFHGIITLHYVQACKIHIYTPRKTLLSLLITYLVPTLIPIWPQSHGLWLSFLKIVGNDKVLNNPMLNIYLPVSCFLILLSFFLSFSLFFFQIIKSPFFEAWLDPASNFWFLVCFSYINENIFPENRT